MPPFLPRKRLASTPPASPKAGPSKRARLADILDAPPKPALARPFTLGDTESSSLSDLDSDEFEDVPSQGKKGGNVDRQEENEDLDDEDVDWEDAAAKVEEKTAVDPPTVTGDIQLTFRKDDDGPDFGAGAIGARKGPTKREKQVRIQTHTMHVQFLLFHNAIRNNWICDKKVQAILLKQLPGQIMTEVNKWRVASGLVPAVKKPATSPSTSQGKGKDKQKAKKDRNERDWGRPSQRLDPGHPDLSRGDPLVSLLKVLSAYWKKRFAITAPGLRKRGYGTKAQLKHEIQSYRNDEHDPTRHGERIKGMEEFREMAARCEGSRDVGAQLFTALLRGLRIQSRLVASLQPSGYGWTKAEQMSPKKPSQPMAVNDVENDDSDEEGESISANSKSKGKAVIKPVLKTSKSTAKIHGNKSAPIDLDSDSDVDLSDSSVVDVTPSLPKQRPWLYDREVPVPVYWTEAISPITNKVIPCSPLVLATPVATSPEAMAQFEPRGAKAEKAKVVMAYVVAYSSDGSAKDVTTRYLKKHIWPGKTRGFRLPVDKTPVYNKHGKIKRYEEHDWFKAAMSGYVRTDVMRTAVDDVEDTSDLVPQLPEKKKEEEGDTLSNLKTSADFVLEQHLRREQALLPGAQPDRMFHPGKGKPELPVYRRDDVVRCLTAESWHKEGRRPRPIEQPMKKVPVRAVTLTRKREAEEHQQRTGEKQMQGLYSEAQTEYIIPPPIENGVIPKNSYGNMDCFVPSMVPKGAVHIPLKGTMRVCKKLEIDFAEAVTGFEFGNKRAVPVCTGVVVAQENERVVKDAWKQWAEEQRIKEDAKAQQKALDNWRKLVIGLRIREKVQEAYGDDDNEDDMVENRKGRTAKQPINLDEDDDEAMPNGEDVGGGGFLLPHEDENVQAEDLVMEHHEPVSKKEAVQYPTPTSIPATSSNFCPRESLLREEEPEDESLSSEAFDSNMEQDDQDGDEAPKPKISVEISTARKGLGWPPKSKIATRGDINEDESDLSPPEKHQSDENSSDEESTSTPGDSDSEEFTPPTKRKHSKASATTQQTGTPWKRTRTPRTASRTTASSTKAGSTRKAAAPKTTTTPKRRSLRRDSTLVTSPYFATE